MSIALQLCVRRWTTIQTMLETLTLSVTMLEDTLRRLHDSGAGYKYSDLLTYYSTQNVEHERT